MNFGQQEVEKIAPFMVIFCDLHYNVIQRGCEGISGENYIIARNCLTYMIVNMSKVRVGYLIDAYITNVAKSHKITMADFCRTSDFHDFHDLQRC